MPVAWTQSATPDSDVLKLVRQSYLNGIPVSDHITDHTRTRKISITRQKKNGRVAGEPVRVYESYPKPGGGWILQKLISENDLPPSLKRANKEQQRIMEEMEKALRQAQKKAKDVAVPTAVDSSLESRCEPYGYTTVFGDHGAEIAFSISDFLCAGEFYAPHHERWQDRDTTVLSFRPRAGYRPPSKARAPIANLAGAVWIDEIDKVVARLEAWLATQDGPAEGGLQPNSHPGAVVLFEEKRLPDGNWFREVSRINTLKSPARFNGVGIDVLEGFSDHRKFTAEAGVYNVDVTKPKP